MSVETFLFWGIDKEILIVEGGFKCMMIAVAGRQSSGVRWMSGRPAQKRCAGTLLTVTTFEGFLTSRVQIRKSMNRASEVSS